VRKSNDSSQVELDCKKVSGMTEWTLAWRLYHPQVGQCGFGSEEFVMKLVDNP